MRRIALFLSVMGVLFCISCGGGSSSSSAPITKIAKRAFVSNQVTSTVEIIDASKDLLSINTSTGLPNSIGAGAAPTLMVETQDKKDTVVYSSSSNSLNVIDNSKESVTNSVNLRAATESFAISQNDRFLYAAERNTIASGATLAGAVEIFDLNNVSAGATVVSVPGARQLVLSHNGNTVLVFSDNSNTVSVINANNVSATPASIPGFDNPIFAVFTNDDSTAYVLNCGPECGGTTAGVATVSVGTLAITNSMTLPAARTALLNGTTLYVAGTVPASPPTPAHGVLNILNAGTLSITTPVSGGVPITDGTHDRIALGSNGKLFIGARACSNLINIQGCLAIYDTTSNPTTAVIHAPYTDVSGALPGDITGIEPIPGRNIVYVCEGGELRIYDTTTNALQPTPAIDIVGKAVDVKEVF